MSTFCKVEELSEYPSSADHTSLNRIDTISNAMELRGFGKDKKEPGIRNAPFEKGIS